jgi:hypothetical protein
MQKRENEECAILQLVNTKWVIWVACDSNSLSGVDFFSKNTTY